MLCRGLFKTVEEEQRIQQHKSYPSSKNVILIRMKKLSNAQNVTLSVCVCLLVEREIT